MVKWLGEILDRWEDSKSAKRAHELALKECNSCRVLEKELTRSREALVSALNIPAQTPEPQQEVERQPVGGLKKSWAVKRAELELKHRKPIKPVTIESLDEEIENAK